MIHINPEGCDGRKVIIEKRQPNGTWARASIVFDCSHSAGEAFVVMVSVAYGGAMLGSISVSNIPKLEDFRLTYIDELPVNIDDAIEDTSQACDILNQIKGKI